MYKLICSTLLLSAVMLAQQPLEILEGVYGAGNFQMNVTPKLQALVQNNVLEMAVDPAVLGGDPAPGQAKRLRVRYRVAGGVVQEFSAGDFERFRLPAAAASNTPGNWAAGAIPATTQPAPAPAGGFSIGDIWGGQQQAQLKIVAARYGAGSRTVDVRERLQALVKDNTLSVRADNAAFGDPAPAVAKTLEVTYEYRGAQAQTSVKEGAMLTLPTAGAAATAPAMAPALRIVSARYGGDNRFADVRERLQSMVRDNRLAIKADNATMGSDPAVGKDKSLEIVYEWSGAYYSATLREGRSATYPEAGARPMANPPAAAGAAAAPPIVSANPGQLPTMTAAGNNNSAPPPVTATGTGPVRSPGQVAPIGTAGGLRIFYARYGAPGQEVDVRESLRPQLRGEALSVVVGPQALGGDPAPGVAKRATVVYEFKGRTYQKTGGDGESIQLP
ncbi:MAG: DUF3395 domain-containing protein [Bryobacterales bacterium]|nr:DUF3395 domain-containing protein [Bryobacterales bacterium]